jgi:hypothetical protein
MNDNFGFWLVVYAACCAVAWFIGKPIIEANFGPDMTPYTRAEPYDPAGAARDGYSPYYPRGGR